MAPDAAPQTPSIEHILAHELKVKSHQVWSAIRLLDSGATVPFIARYRKEATGGLTDTHLRLLAERLDALRELEARRAEILQSVESLGKLSPELRAALESAETKSRLEDLYLPYRPRQVTKAQLAREAGLEPLALLLLASPERVPTEEAAAFVDALKNVPGVAEALAGAREILVEKFSEDAALVGSLRERFWEQGWMVSKAVPGKAAADSKFSDYFNYREKLKGIPSHRALAIFRGRQEGVLQVTLDTEALAQTVRRPDDDAEFVGALCERFGVSARRRPADAWLLDGARFAWRYKVRLHLELDLFMRLRKSAEAEAIDIFAENMRNLLLAAPAGPRATLGLDPGFRTGVKIAAVDRTGKLVATATIFPHPPENDRDRAARTIEVMVEKYAVELIAIGNGTASRETERVVDAVLKAHPDWKVSKAVVSEAGASVYSASALASAELPSTDVTLRGAVSIARRLQDPLAELVKIDPKAIGVGQYQHDVNQSRLMKSLRGVVEDCVNAVGVDVNMASPELLSYVAGFTPRTAAALVARRDARGAFRTREELKGLPELGAKAFEQAAGFLRIRGGDNPLDASAVHPEAYPVVERLLARHEKKLDEVLGNDRFLRALRPEDYVDDAFGVPTVEDILDELEKPGRDPRPEFKTATFKEGVEKIGDLKPGMSLEGTVTNVAAFGAFVDVGVHQDGLVHVSQLADRFVQDPHEVVKTGQVVRVRVVEIDLARNRIALTMRASSK
jgi:uncharacterized protein